MSAKEVYTEVARFYIWPSKVFKLFVMSCYHGSMAGREGPRVVTCQPSYGCNPANGIRPLQIAWRLKTRTQLRYLSMHRMVHHAQPDHI